MSVLSSTIPRTHPANAPGAHRKYPENSKASQIQNPLADYCCFIAAKHSEQYTGLSLLGWKGTLASLPH
ncbi:MAG: hypothetical protein IKY53_00850 [Lachnospiraceae bacterium]|nr:hypothetical protein [Lachnospiraceae bacterium]